MNLDTHGGQRCLGEEGLLANIPSGEIHEAERNVTAQPAKLHGDVPSEAGRATGDDRDFPAPTFADRLRTRFLERSSTRLRGLVLPRGPVAEAEGWQWHEIRRYGRFWGPARRQDQKREQ